MYQNYHRRLRQPTLEAGEREVGSSRFYPPFFPSFIHFYLRSVAYDLSEALLQGVHIRRVRVHLPVIYCFDGKIAWESKLEDI